MGMVDSWLVTARPRGAGMGVGPGEGGSRQAEKAGRQAGSRESGDLSRTGSCVAEILSL